MTIVTSVAQLDPNQKENFAKAWISYLNKASVRANEKSSFTVAVSALTGALGHSQYVETLSILSSLAKQFERDMNGLDDEGAETSELPGEYWRLNFKRRVALSAILALNFKYLGDPKLLEQMLAFSPYPKGEHEQHLQTVLNSEFLMSEVA